MKTDSEEYISYLKKKVEIAKGKLKRVVFFPNEELSPDVVSAVRAEFSDYKVEIWKCKSCRNVYDITIEW